MLWLLPTPAIAAETDSMTLLEDELELETYESLLEKVDQLLADADTDLSLQALWQAYRSGERQLDMELFWDALISLFFAGLRTSGAMLVQIVALATLAALLSRLQNSGEGGDVAQLSHWVVYLLLLALALLAWKPAVQGAQEAVSLLRDLLLATLPLLLPLLASLGAVSTVATISPLLFGGMELLTTLLSGVVFPLVYLSAVLRLAGGMTERFSMSKLADLLKDVAMGAMSVLTTLFMAVLGFIGVASSSSDGLAVKAVKTASGAFIPVVGRTLADSLDSVMGTALLLKNGIGLIGALAIILVCAVPALRLLAQSLLFRLAAALIQPLGEPSLSEALGGMGRSLTQLFAVVALCGLFGFFTLALMVGLGNLTMMMR